MKLFSFCFVLLALRCFAQTTEKYELPPINYSKATPQDATETLQKQITTGEVRFKGNDREIVRDLLRQLRVPVESQVVVFSKTSFQRDRIRPEHPRAIYFSDNCYIGWVPGGLVEVTTIDPVLGPIFYTLSPAALRANSPQTFVRDGDCLRCHGGNFVRGIPGVFVRSVFADKEGEPLLRHGSEVVDMHTPFTNRWGGWYVTGKHGAALHRGNVFAREKQEKLSVDFRSGANIRDLSKFFDTEEYLSGSSDIVALLVLECQTAVQNTLTRASVNCRYMLLYQKNLQHDLKEPVSDELVYDSVKSVFNGAAKEIVDDLLFHDEARLPEGLEGSPDFQRAFQADAPRTSAGDSLKDFSLDGHLFKNRCHYLVYSDVFLQLPAQLKRLVYERLATILKSTKPEPRYAYLGKEERHRITAILQTTHKELAAALAQ